jgi:maleylacetate reductase
VSPTQYLFGSVAILANHLDSWSPSGALVLASSQRHLSVLMPSLAAYETRVFSGAKVHVPIEVVEAAEADLAETGANAVVAIGGGSPIGLGKALALRAAEAGRVLRFVAIPTTYAGSERTSIFGITRGRDKQTGRDERVRPELVIYDAELTLDLPIALTTQSLCNAIAHVASVLSTNSLPERAEVLASQEPAIGSQEPAIGAHSDRTSAAQHVRPDRSIAAQHVRPDRTIAAQHARAVVDVIDPLLASPRDLAARTDALALASACASMLDAGKPGVQHGFAHLLGGAFGIDHAALHSILLPHFLAHFTDVRDAIANSPRNALVDAILDAAPIVRLDEHVRALLARAGAPTQLRELGITREALDEVLATRPELPGDIARAAF